MATVKLLVRGKGNPSNLYVRFVDGRNLDISTRTSILINPKHWDKKSSNLKNLKDIKDRFKKYQNFERLKLFLLEQYSDAFISGDVTDRKWLLNTVNLFYNRPTSGSGISNNKLSKKDIYYFSFAENWLENDAKNWKVSSGKNLNQRAIKQYESFLSIFKKFDPKLDVRIKDIDNTFIMSFIDFMQKKQSYGYETTKRHVGRLRFFLNRAENKGLKINPSYKERVYVEKLQDEIKKPYLNENEINSLYDLDLTNNDELDSIRDNFIIGLWTGLRISDFNSNLDVSNISSDYIDIKTKKTGTWVSIPLHPQVKAILDKRHGNLPIRFTDNLFNEKIKLLCKYAEIDNEIIGDLKDPETNRNKRGVYKKYKLISSHTCRRSFATNLFGIVPNSVIQSVGGWSTEAMMLHYIKKTSKDNAKILKETWEMKYKNK